MIAKKIDMSVGNKHHKNNGMFSLINNNKNWHAKIWKSCLSEHIHLFFINPSSATKRPLLPAGHVGG